MRMNLPILVGLAVAAVAPAVATGDPVVLSVDGDRVYVDLGAEHGVGAGARLELWREIVARDPSTGATLRDRFAFGELTVQRAGAKVCEARVGDELRGRVQVGDTVALASPAARYVDSWADRVAASRRPVGAPPPSPDAPARDRAAAERAVAAAAEVHAVWRSTLGQPPSTRVALWQAFVDAHPDSPYAPAIRTEQAALTAQAQALDRAAAAVTSGPVVDRRLALAQALAALRGDVQAGSPLWAAVPTRVRPGEPVGFTFAIPTALPAGAAWLYVRPEGATGFTRVPLVADGDAYLRAALPGDQVRAGDLAWFIEIGDAAVGQGTRDQPQVIDVDAEVTEPPPAAGRTSIVSTIDYVDFDGGLASGFDQYFQAEAAFTYRFLEPVYAVSVGAGTMSGKGGPKDVIDGDPAGMCLDSAGDFRCRQVDFSYVYTEIELRPRKNLAVMIRPQAGLLTTDTSATSTSQCRDGTTLDDCDFFTGFGVRGRVRLGNPDGANLELGVGITSRVGTLFEAAYHAKPRPDVPVKLAVQVTDMPVPEDFGVRLVADVGWQGKRWVYPSVRVSYQARDIDHGGLSGGLGLNFDW